MSLKITNEQFSELVTKAKRGEEQALHQFLKQLYRNGKRSLLSLTKSEVEAEEYFSVAVAKFWEKFVEGDSPLPKTNVSGYIYTMAKFLCLDQKRSPTTISVITTMEPAAGNPKEPSELPRTEGEYREQERGEERRRKAMRQAIAKLSNNCRKLFRTMLETGLEKPRELFEKIGLKDARTVTVLRYECTKQLKVKAAVELELLIQAEKRI